MDKTKIKNFAVNARKELIDSVRQRLANFGIDKTGIADELPISTATVKYYTNEHFPLKGKAIDWRKQIVSRIKQDTNQKWDEKLNQFIDEVAYTWFNRIIAIRFMEVNDYLPSRTRVLSSEEGRIEPDMITHALEIEDDLGGYSDKERTQITDALMSHNPTQLDKVFGMLFIKQTDELSNLLPGLFEKTSDYMKLLFVPNYSNGVIKELVDEIPEEDFDVSKSGQVTIIGWLYQDYNTEPKNDAFKKKKFAAEDIPAATQLFTPDWIVKYLVENSLGRYWIKMLQSRGDTRTESEIAQKYGWVYFCPSDDSDKEIVLVKKQVEELKFIDPAMGSGHILVYAFDILMQIYRSEGYSDRQSVRSILTNNLFGLEIDDRAYQLAYFSLMMKAREFDRRVLTRNLNLNIMPVPVASRMNQQYVKDINITSNQKLILDKVVDLFRYGNEYGSAIVLPQGLNENEVLTQLEKREETFIGQLGLNDVAEMDQISSLRKIIKATKLLSSEYDVGVTNPPYMGLRRMDDNLKKYIKKQYPSHNQDMFSVFMRVMSRLVTNGHGYIGMITQHSWMFIKTFEKTRKYLNLNQTIINMAHLGARAFGDISGEVVQTTAFILLNKPAKNYVGSYERLVGGSSEEDKKRLYLECIKYPNSSSMYRISQHSFDKIPGSPIAYWAPQALINDFEKGKPLGQLVDAKVGLQTGNNKRFLRYWYEVDFNNIFFDAHNTAEAKQSGKKWFPYNKGGSYRKWYGNYDYVVNWQNDGYEIKHFTDSRGKVRSRPQNTDYYFKNAITWPLITSGNFSMRFRTFGSIHDVAGMSAFSDNPNTLKLILGLGNSSIMKQLVGLLNPTINYQIGDIERIPVLHMDKTTESAVIQQVDHAISLSKHDWDQQEESWDYGMPSVIQYEGSNLEQSLNNWLSDLQSRYYSMKNTEQNINGIFNRLYGLDQTEDSIESPISVRLPESRETTVFAVNSLLSYFIGCVFGRYSLDKLGLAYAGGNWNESVYGSFKPNQDNLILLTDRDYFGDERDIINRLKEFLRITFAPSSLNDNLHFIAKTLDPKKSERGESDEQIIRNYFLNDFYKDHDKTYHKRPIYWQFNSGRNDGFKALMYLHRYNKDELAMVRNYLHDLQAAYSNTIKFNDEQETKSSTAREKNQYRKDTVKLNKKVTEVIKYDEALQHQALAQVSIDLDDGVVVNHAKVQGNEELFSKL
ncbi:BREX-1 system adenine-specific DNA-methyltransferase PglX [Limosilactobacillus reuteri]|uniref:BREX-1 system adenine-specific DNA-methyltransferase PglX n=1 Tax=Limosilactobacillus reuteri TaxID=1598 RepID=UPI000A1F892D|nr:BREX-1 system adenine-specific DNA-methyltransferase PglX [Limosilactobacillus reuteri]